MLGTNDSNQQNNKEPALLLEGFLTLDQLAEQLGRSPRTIRRWAAQGKGLPCVRQGSLILYPIAEIKALWLAHAKSSSSHKRRTASVKGGQGK